MSPSSRPEASRTLGQVLVSVCPLDRQCIRVNGQVIKSSLSPYYPFSCWVYGWIRSDCQQCEVPLPGLGGKQSLSYSTKLMPVWLNALDTSSRGFWSFHYYSFRAYGASPHCARSLSNFLQQRSICYTTRNWLYCVVPIVWKYGDECSAMPLPDARWQMNICLHPQIH